MARRTPARPSRRGAGPAVEPRIRSEVGAIALAAFAVLSLIALLVDQGAVLHWWRSSLIGLLGWGAAVVPPALGLAAAVVWSQPVRSRLVAPAAGAFVVFIALLGLTHAIVSYELDTSVSGAIGGAIGGLAVAALGRAGSLIVFTALFVVGIVIAADRTLGDLTASLWRRRPSLELRPGTMLPGGTATKFKPEPRARTRNEDDDEDEGDAMPPAAVADEPLRINMPAERAPKAAVPAPPPVRTAPAPTDPGGPLAGLPSAAVAAEGVLHADPPETPWVLPSIELLEEGSASRSGKDEVLRNTKVIEETLAHFSISAKVVEVSVGPVVTRYELKPAAGVKLSRIEALADDLSLALAARSLRIEAPVPGKSVVGIEVPNLAIGLVSLKDVAETAQFRDATSKLMVALGRDVAGSPIVLDLAKMPHLLVAGQTGSGKSVCISSIICSLLLSSTPDDVRFVIGDMKRVDFAGFNGLPHLVVPVMTDHDKILNALYWATGEMDRRYRLFARASARNIAGYNEKRTGQDRIPYIVFIIDELADLMLQAPIQVEKAITRIAQLARATGIHLVLGTQRPSVDVITGLIKANIPARIAFATASAVDSRTILDMTGAEKLLGRGDMLVLPPDIAKPVRAQGVFVSDREIELVTAHWKQQRAPSYDMAILEDKDRARMKDDDDASGIDDDRYAEAVEIVRRAGQASVSMLQRKMTIGFARAGRLIDVMEQHGVVGPPKGPGKMREVYGASARAGAEEDE